MDAIIYGIWCLCHPESGIRYVGQTSRGIDRRMREHIADARNRPKRGLHHWINKHGADNVGYCILEVCLPDELDQREEFWIDHLGTHSDFGNLNITAGGGGARGYHQTAEHRAKISAATTGVPKPGVRLHKLGKKLPEETVRKMRATLSEKFSGEGGPGAILKWSDMPVIFGYSALGMSGTDIAKLFGVSRYCISDVLNGKTWKNWEAHQ